MLTLPSFRRAKTGFSLIEILVVMVVIVAIAGLVSYNYLGKGKPGEKKVTPINEAKKVACQSNLQQIRTGIQTFKTMNTDAAENGNGEPKNPETLKEMKLPQELLECPEGHEPYQYDPASGTVHCVHPGHENL